MDFDDALRLVGVFGKYQRQFYLMVSLPALFKGFQVMLVVFTVFVPKHRCAVPGLLNDSYHITSEDHRRLVLDAIPTSLKDGESVFDGCHVFADFAELDLDLDLDLVRMSTLEEEDPHDGLYSNGASLGNASAVTSLPTINRNESDRPLEACSRWVYDRSEVQSSLITKFDLVCGRKEYRAHSNMMLMFGFLVGSTIASILCDWLGRKLIYCCSLVLMMAFGVASAFPTSPEMLLAFRFLSGVGLMGVMVSGFVLAVEMIGGTMRTKMGACWQIVWLAGPFILCPLSYVMRDWRLLQLVGSVPVVVFVVYWWLVPESPRWLVSKGRVDEAMVTLTKAAKVNKHHLPPSLAGQLKANNLTHHEEGMVSPLAIFRSPTLFVRFLVISFNWCVISMTYYGLSLNVANLSGGIRINFLLSCVVELLGYGAAVFLLDVFGRKKVHTFSMLGAGLACLLTIFTVMYAGQDLQWLTTALAMIGKFGVSSSFAIIFLYSAELYPTVLRNFGVGCGSMFARIGSMVSPYIADLALYVDGSFGMALPLIVFGTLAVAAGLVSLLLPETLHRKLPETLDDAINFGKNPLSQDDRISSPQEKKKKTLDRVVFTPVPKEDSVGLVSSTERDPARPINS